MEDTVLVLEDNWNVRSLDHFEDQIDTHCKIVGNAGEGIDAVLACVEDEVHRSDGEVAFASAMDARSRCILHVDRSIPVGEDLVDIHQVLVYHSKVLLHRRALFDRKLLYYFLRPLEIHELVVEVGYNIDLPYENEEVAFESHAAERHHFHLPEDGHHKGDRSHHLRQVLLGHHVVVVVVVVS